MNKNTARLTYKDGRTFEFQCIEIDGKLYVEFKEMRRFAFDGPKPSINRHSLVQTMKSIGDAGMISGGAVAAMIESGAFDMNYEQDGQ